MSVSQLADIKALESVPLTKHNLPANTYVALEKSAKQWPDASALTFFLDANKFQKKQTWTYSQLFADITRAANAFYQLGVSKDDVIAFVLPNLPETHFTIWGGEATGIVMAINPLLEGGQIAELIRSARAKVLVTLAPTPNVDLWQKLRAHLQDMPDIRTVVWVNMAPYVGIKAPILHYLAMHEQHSIRNLKIFNLRSLMKKQPSTHLLSGRVIQSQEPSSYFCTGGTTGLPKIAVRNHGNEVFDAWAITHLMDKPEQHQAKNVFCGLPLFHVNGQLVTGLMTWVRGDHVILGTPQGYRGVNVVKHFWQIVEHYQINLFSGVPTLYAGLMQQDASPYNISSLEYAICGAAPMPVELFKNFEQKTGVRILEGYGLTEGTCVSSINPPDGESRIGSIGLRLPWQAMKAIILDEQGQYQRDAQIDEVGVIVISGPNVFSGYLNPIHNKGLWIAIDGQQWLNTGDLGRQDKDGYFWLTGRKKELIIRGGHNIDPKSIEEPLHQHPAVAMAAAVGMPDAYAGELPVAYVELKPNSQTSETELLAFLAEHIQERAAQPKYIRLIDKMPVTAVGKIFKPSLQILEIERVILQECESLNIQLDSLAVVQDNKRGLVAKLSYQGNTDILKDKLAQYTFAVEWL